MSTHTERKDRWEETCEVRFGPIDRSDRMTLASVFNFFQEAAISHAENLGVGRDSMAQSGRGWILCRISVQVNQRPYYGDNITIRTWPRGVEKLFAVRDYDIRNTDDIPVIQARSNWLVIDIEKRRPLRPQSAMDGLPLNEGCDALPSGAVGLAEQANLQKTAELKAAYSDLDYNGHVNNVSYIHWIQNTVEPAELLEKAVHMRLDINYLNEILPGEIVEIWSAPIAFEGRDGITDGGDSSGRAFAFEGRKSTGPAAFRAELRLWGFTDK